MTIDHERVARLGLSRYGSEKPQVMMILVCDACGTKTPLDLIPTASPACQTCGTYGKLELHEAVIVQASVPPAERYAWTPWLEAGWITDTGGFVRRIVREPVDFAEAARG